MLFYGQDIRIDFSVLLSIYDMCAEPLGDRLPLFPPRMAFFYRVLPLCFVPLPGGALCHFRQKLYHFGTYLADIFAFYPAPEAVEKQYLSIFQPVGTDDILVHDVCYEILI